MGIKRIWIRNWRWLNSRSVIWIIIIIIIAIRIIRIIGTALILSVGNCTRVWVGITRIIINSIIFVVVIIIIINWLCVGSYIFWSVGGFLWFSWAIVIRFKTVPTVIVLLLSVLNFVFYVHSHPNSHSFLSIISLSISHISLFLYHIILPYTMVSPTQLANNSHHIHFLTSLYITFVSFCGFNCTSLIYVII